MTRLPLEQIRIDGGTQPREVIDTALVAEYAEAITDRAEFPPVVVYFDGVDNWLADGFHRWHAHRKAGLLEIEAEVITGTQRDAILYSVGANATNGQRRTNADKRKAVFTLLTDPEWSKWSDHEIARQCAVDRSWVGDLRRSLVVTTSDDATPPRTFTTKHGTVSTMNTTAIGRKREEGVARAKTSKETAPAGIRRLPKQDNLVAFRRGVQSLQGLCFGLKQVTTSELCSAPDLEQLRNALGEAIHELRAVYRTIGGSNGA